MLRRIPRAYGFRRPALPASLSNACRSAAPPQPSVEEPRSASHSATPNTSRPRLLPTRRQARRPQLKHCAAGARREVVQPAAHCTTRFHRRTSAHPAPVCIARPDRCRSQSCAAANYTRCPAGDAMRRQGGRTGVGGGEATPWPTPAEGNTLPGAAGGAHGLSAHCAYVPGRAAA